MTKIILDPGMFEIDINISKKEQLNHYFYLLESIKFISTYFDATLDQYNGAPYIYFYSDTISYQAPPVTASHTIKDNYVEIKKYIQKLIKKGEVVELGNDIIQQCDLNFVPNSMLEDAFKKYLWAAINSKNLSVENTIILLSHDNIMFAPKVAINTGTSIIYFAAFGSPAIDCNNIVGTHLEYTVDEHEKFPYCEACAELNTAFLAEIDNPTSNKKQLYIKFGKETAHRNGYIEDISISKKNPHHYVFVRLKEKYYISIDEEHGGLELFCGNGNSPTHQGEYDFSCCFKKEADPSTHKITI